MGKILGSIATKIAGIVLALTGLVATAVGVGFVVFSSVSQDMTFLAEEQIPALRVGTELNANASALHDALVDMLLAPDTGTLDRAAQAADASADTLAGLMQRLPAEAAAALKDDAGAMRSALKNLRAARLREFGSEAAINRAQAEVEALFYAVGITLTEQADNAFFDAAIAAEIEAADRAQPATPGGVRPAARLPETSDVQNAIFWIRASDDLNLAVKGFYASALEAGLAEDDAELAIVQDRLESAAATIDRLSRSGDMSASLPELAALEALAGFVDPVTGIVNQRREILAARHAAHQLAEDATLRVAEIEAFADTDSTARLQQIALDSREIEADATEATIWMQGLALASLLIVALAGALVTWVIVKPLLAVSRATTRLSTGDLTALDGMRRHGGEIGQMLRALGVFRDGIIEQRRLQAEEALAHAERDAEQRQAAEAERRREIQERERTAEQERLDRAREAAQATQRDAMRDAVERERQISAAAQDRVVTALADGLRRLADGDLRVAIDQRFEDSYDQLRIDFNAAVASLATAIGDIRDSALSIHAGSGSIAAAAEDLSRRTEQSAATLEQSAAALTELTAAVGSAAQGAGQADQTVMQARQSAERSNVVVKDAIAAMDEIKQSSSRISGIIDVIDDIAFQTNLLALNAGVEAARAGEAGRGFAVVASEVRALSQRSSEAAREISALIADSSRHVGRGVDLVNQVGASLHLIVGSITSISENVSAIAASTREQSTGISEINIAVSRLDQSTQQNAGMVEETTAASRDLTGEAEALTQIIHRFTVETGPRSRSAGDQGGDVLAA
ncbi:methyl-accepting chemotaxis protein [Frigidibacter albus]|nr:methyl-accepting chemotaxis protein [Frigidibacter albus]